MIEAGRCVGVLDPYKWLPSYGENSVNFHTDKLDFCVTLTYDTSDELKEKIIRFKTTFAFYKCSFPGPNLLNINYAEDSQRLIASGWLVEYPDSQATKFWRDRNDASFAVKHYMMAFLSENIIIEVFSEDVNLEIP